MSAKRTSKIISQTAFLTSYNAKRFIIKTSAMSRLLGQLLALKKQLKEHYITVSECTIGLNTFSCIVVVAKEAVVDFTGVDIVIHL